LEDFAMPGSESFDEVIARLRDGDQDAAAEVFHRYARRIVGLARSRLDTGLQARVDPESVAQSVFRSFFIRHGQEQFELTDWDGLWSLLVRITLRKCGRQVAHHRAARRDVQKERGVAVPEEGSFDQHWEAISRDPTPDEAVALTETVEILMEQLDETQRRVVTLRLQGSTIPEISAEVQRTERTVNRILAHVRESLMRLDAPGKP
jgi:RNA polymerase sigma-70 factor (ECF subfamily)